MLRTNRVLVVFLVCIGVLFGGSCSEDSVTSSQDKVGPTVQFIQPTFTSTIPDEISDRVDIYVTAKDNSGIEKVEIWGSPENGQNSILIKSSDSPLDPVPDSVQAPSGAAVYGARWSVRTIRNGTRVRLFARAFDLAGNITRSDIVLIKVLNRGGDLRPPVARFFITPTQGTVDTLFVFNAEDTSDSVDAPTEISVRWDFDGDGVWDKTWEDGLKASVPVDFRYPRASVYNVVLEAKNTYLPDSVGRAVQPVDVAPSGGKTPDPPEPGNMILISAGTYRVGTADTLIANANEVPVHSARLTAAAEFYIEKTEVPNRLYLRFLKEAMAGEAPLVRREVNVLWYDSDSDQPREIVNFDNSALYFDPIGDSVAIVPESRNLPVVGVTWYGAKAYAEYFGLRLPTEHEWEIAAKADSVNFNYPWGKTIAPEQANYNFLAGGIHSLREIGSYPGATSPWGVLDLCGNAREWVKDWFASYSSGTLINPEGPVNGTQKVLRGGSFLSSGPGVRVTARGAADPILGSSEIGFRTAYTKP